MRLPRSDGCQPTCARWSSPLPGVWQRPLRRALLPPCSCDHDIASGRGAVELINGQQQGLRGRGARAIPRMRDAGAAGAERTLIGPTSGPTDTSIDKPAQCAPHACRVIRVATLLSERQNRQARGARGLALCSRQQAGGSTRYHLLPQPQKTGTGRKRLTLVGFSICWRVTMAARDLKSSV